MPRIRRTILGLLLALQLSALPAAECVVLLHGLARTADSMASLAESLAAAGYRVVNVDYPSRDKPIEALAEIAVSAGLEDCKVERAMPVNFVTHSLGGILVRQYYSQHPPHGVKRVVMLAPPNQGSEVVDQLKDVPGFELINGPAGRQLGTDEASVPNRLGPVNFELGVIAGTQTFNLILSNFLPNPDDGKVSLERTKVDGMCSLLALPATHTFMMRNDRVIGEVIHFLQEGRFADPSAQASDCTFAAHPHTARDNGRPGND